MAALGIEKTDLSPGVRRMLALVGSEARSITAAASWNAGGAFGNAKAVERTAESIGGDMARREQPP